jgi:von Willebrand factor type A domain
MKKILLKALLIFSVVLLSGSERVWAQADVVIAVDLSKTMNDNDPHRLRYYGADLFLSMLSYYDDRNRNRAGVVTFGNGAEPLMEFGYVSRDKVGQYHRLFENIKSEDWTELGLGLQLAAQKMGEDQSRAKSIIVISDFIIEGNPDARHLSPDQAQVAAEQELLNVTVPELKRRRIKVYTIGLFGLKTKGRHLMETLANETGGFYREVEEAKEFYAIYKGMLESIEPSSGRTTIKGENNRFPLTPADYGVIITGQGDFSVRAPNGIVYPAKSGDGRSVVSQQYVQYPDGGSVLFLGQPAASEQQLSDNWTGEWIVEMQGEGEATYLSNVRFTRSAGLPPRPAFFKNEYVPINYALNVRADIDPHTRTFLENCQTSYTIVHADQSGWAKSGALNREKFAYSGSQLVDRAGEFLLEVQLSCGQIRYRNLQEKFKVHNVELLQLAVLHGQDPKPLQGQTLDEGEKIRVEGLDNIAEMAKQYPEYMGLKDRKLNLELRYNSAPPQKANFNPSQDDRLLSDERELEETGALSIDGEFEGTLIVKKHDGGGMDYYPVKAKTSKMVQIKRTWKVFWELMAWWIGLTSGIVGLVITPFTLWRDKQRHDITGMSLEGARGLSRPFGEVNLPLSEWFERGFVLKGGPYISIGGPTSNADVTLPQGGNTILAEIGKDLFNNFYIVQKGDKQIYVRSEALAPNVRKRIEPNDTIKIEGMDAITFKQTFGDPGD